MKNQIILAVMVLSILVAIGLLVSGCGTVSIKDLKENPENYLGKEITVRGIVENTIKIGDLSGFSLREGDYSIAVSSKELPAEGKTVTVKGTVMKELIIGYYIYANKIY